jgi:hypothetical protein
MLETKVIKRVSIEKGKVASLTFVHNKNEYTVKITPKNVILSQSSDRGEIPVAEYSPKTGKSRWYLSHSCGAQGFGLGLDDKCYACDVHDSKLDVTPKNMGIIMTSGQYTSELFEVLSSGVIDYCQKLETLIKSV